MFFIIFILKICDNNGNYHVIFLLTLAKKRWMRFMKNMCTSSKLHYFSCINEFSILISLSENEYVKGTYFHGYMFSRISRFLAIFAKINTRKMFQTFDSHLISQEPNILLPSNLVGLITFTNNFS